MKSDRPTKRHSTLSNAPLHQASAKRTRYAVTICATSTLALAAVAVPAQADTPDPVALNILGITDFHGHLTQEKDKNGTITNIGAAELACYVSKQRANNPNTSFVSAGDNIGGSPFMSSILHDKPTLDALNAMGLEASAVGNHELDKGWDDLSTRVSVNATGQAKFPYLAANMAGVDVPPYLITERDGVKIAYVGAITDTTPTLVSPSGIKGITFSDPIAATKKQADELKGSGKADVVIALTHEGVSSAGYGNNVDAVIAGHTHVVRDEQSTPVVIQPGNYGDAIADIDISYDKANHKVLSVKATNHSAADMHKECADSPDPTVSTIVDEAQKASEKEGNKIVAHTDQPFFRGASAKGEPGSNRGTESSLNSLVADSVRDGINKKIGEPVDIGVMNAGGVRADLPAGDITYANAFQVLPFSNSLGIVTLSGQEFIDVLENQWQPHGSQRSFLALGLSKNVHYTYDPTAADGHHITHVTIDGKPLDPHAQYRVAGNTFLLGGGDSFTGFGTTTGKHTVEDTGIMDVDAFIDYLAHEKDLTPRPNQTSVGVALSGPGVDAQSAESGEPSVIPGKEITVKLSSLSYTAGEQTPDSVTVTLKGSTGETSKEAQVDNTIVADTDETGRAEVTVVVPEGATSIHIKTNTGTECELPITAKKVSSENPSDGQSPLLIGSAVGSSLSS